MADILGTGLAFPLGVDRRGGIALAVDEDDVEQAIGIILTTAPGERPMRPEFGCAVHDYVFDVVDAGTLGRMEEEIRARCERWEPRIDVLAIGFDLDGAGDGALCDLDRLPPARRPATCATSSTRSTSIPADEAD